MDDRFRASWRKYRSAFIIALLVLYLPQTWIFWVAIQAPSAISGAWIATFPTMPGGFIAAVIRTLYWNRYGQHLPDSLFLLIAFIFTVLLIALLTRIGERSRGFQIAAILLGGGYSIVAALGMHAAFRM